VKNILMPAFPTSRSDRGVIAASFDAKALAAGRAARALNYEAAGLVLLHEIERLV